MSIQKSIEALQEYIDKMKNHTPSDVIADILHT